jgi:hypothetical protein
MSMICRGEYIDVQQYGLIMISKRLAPYVVLIEGGQENK